MWFARLARTRTAAAKLVTEGVVRVGGRRVSSASHGLKIGDVVTLVAHGRTHVMEVVDLGERRGGAPEAARLWRDPTGAIRDRPERPGDAPDLSPAGSAD